MVWFYGGAFIKGSGSTDMYGPEYLLTEDIVLVTLNYRVGVIGIKNFISHFFSVCKSLFEHNIVFIKITIL